MYDRSSEINLHGNFSLKIPYGFHLDSIVIGASFYYFQKNSKIDRWIVLSSVLTPHKIAFLDGVLVTFAWDLFKPRFASLCMASINGGAMVPLLTMEASRWLPPP